MSHVWWLALTLSSKTTVSVAGVFPLGCFHCLLRDLLWEALWPAQQQVQWRISQIHRRHPGTTTQKRSRFFMPLRQRKMDVTIGGCEVNFILTGFHRLRLVGGLEHLDYFSIRLGISYSQLMKSYFSEGLKPPTICFSRFFPSVVKRIHVGLKLLVPRQSRIDNRCSPVLDGPLILEEKT